MPLPLNITPQAEGSFPQSVFDPARDAILQTFQPLFDGVDAEDAIPVVSAAITKLLPSIQAMPKQDRVKVLATAAQAIFSQVLVDLVVVYPDEEA